MLDHELLLFHGQQQSLDCECVIFFPQPSLIGLEPPLHDGEPPMIDRELAMIDRELPMLHPQHSP